MLLSRACAGSSLAVACLSGRTHHATIVLAEAMVLVGGQVGANWHSLTISWPLGVPTTSLDIGH